MSAFRLSGCGVLLALLAGLAGPAQAQTAVRYVHTDALGSVVALTDESRTVVERREYEPYGAQLTPAVQDGPGYTGHVQDAATGLTYMQQRYYDPSIGRFLSVDPVTANPNTGANFNRYYYANNNPYKFTDPDGRQSLLRSILQKIIPVPVAPNSQRNEKSDPPETSGGDGDRSDKGRNTPRPERDFTRRDRDGNPISVGGKKEPPVPDATPGRETKGRTTQWEKTGGIDGANKDFDNKGPTDVVDLPDGGRRGTLPDGRNINVRPDSSDGRPTLEIQDGKNRDKVRYNE